MVISLIGSRIKKEAAMSRGFRITNLNGFFTLGLICLGGALIGGSWMLGLSSVAMLAAGFIGSKFEWTRED